MKRAATKTHLSAEYVKTIFNYEADTGNLIHKRRRPGTKINTIAGQIDNLGYRTVTINQSRYKAHRVIWLIMTGEWPNEVDHINRIKSDNRWSNLRLANRSLNLGNVPARQNNHLKGAYPVGNRWRSIAVLNKKNINLGYFITEQEAHDAYKAFVIEHRGEYASFGYD